MAADFNPFDGPRPFLVFIQSNPWAMVIGSDTPRVAVYENGDIVFAKRLNDKLASYHAATLDKKEVDEIRQRLAPVFELKAVKPSYNVRPNVTDQPEAMFYLRAGNREIATSVYGLTDAYRGAADSRSTRGGKESVPPEELLVLHRWLCGIDYPHSKEWMPKYVEVMLWDFSHTREAPVPWPKAWPSVQSSRAVQRGPQSYSIFLDASSVSKVRELYATLDGRRAVLIGARKMSLAYRFTFPGEPVWREALRAAAKTAEN